jgi:hypothetical protein
MAGILRHFFSSHYIFSGREAANSRMGENRRLRLVVARRHDRCTNYQSCSTCHCRLRPSWGTYLCWHLDHRGIAARVACGNAHRLTGWRISFRLYLRITLSPAGVVEPSINSHSALVVGYCVAERHLGRICFATPETRHTDRCRCSGRSVSHLLHHY